MSPAAGLLRCLFTILTMGSPRLVGRIALVVGSGILSALVIASFGVLQKSRTAQPIALFSPGEPLSTEEEYMTLHPVYTRCSKKADVAAFSKEILLKCGDIHELTWCSWVCTQALQSYADSVGCCWETVMEGYEALDSNASLAWRNWQGTASGKCGVTFSSQTCGDSVGEKSYNDLAGTVSKLSVQAQKNQQFVDMLERLLYGYGSYKQTGGSVSMAQPPSKIGDITADEVIDFPNDGKPLNMGDIPVSVDNIQPWGYARKPEQRQSKKARVSQLYNAYDDFRSYQNNLRLRAGYDKKFKDLKTAGFKQDKDDLNFPNIPGESWTA